MKTILELTPTSQPAKFETIKTIKIVKNYNGFFVKKYSDYGLNIFGKKGKNITLIWTGGLMGSNVSMEHNKGMLLKDAKAIINQYI